MSSALPTIQEQDELLGPGSEVLLEPSTPSATNPSQPITPKASQPASTVLLTDRSSHTLAKTKDITLTEDCFGVYRVENKPPVKIQRFTWKSSDKVEVQIITYGARITSMKYPDKYGKVNDIVLGFNDLSGYLYYGHEVPFGATIGAVTNKIKDAKFELDGKEINLSRNFYNHYCNGGFVGLDKVVWNSYANNTQVIFSYVIPDKQDGLPGPVMINITYELTMDRGFRIDMLAKTAKPTILNLSNLCYFNLGGHHGGPEELRQHSVCINCNCYTLMDENEFPSGKIMNVVHTKFDFSTPKLMKNYLGLEPDDGYDQNLCINRATGQGNCLVARAVHTKNGRVLEIYSNQYGVRFNTANDFGSGLLEPSSGILNTGSVATVEGGVFILINQVYEIMNNIQEYTQENFEEVRKLIVKIRRSTPIIHVDSDSNEKSISFINPDFCFTSFIDTLCRSMAQVESIIPNNVEEVKTWSELKVIVDDVLEKYAQMDVVTANWTLGEEEEQVKTTVELDEEATTGLLDGGAVPNLQKSTQSFRKVSDSHHSQQFIAKSSMHSTGNIESRQSIDKKISSKNFGGHSESRQSIEKGVSASGDKIESKVSITKQITPIQSDSKPQSKESLQQPSQPVISFKKSAADKGSIGSDQSAVLAEYSAIHSPRVLHDFPSFYKDGRIHGKNNAIYKRHGAMAFQTQNYPDAIHHKNFPSPILRPGQTYRHTIVYKFWVQGNDLKTLRTKRKCW